MDMGAMVDVPHACDQEADASTKKTARMNPLMQDEQAHTGIDVE